MGKTGLVHSFLQQSAASFPEKTALVQGKERVSYRDLNKRAAAVCSRLRENGVQPGDRVAILTDQACEYITAYFGIIAAGGIAVGLNTQTSGHSLHMVLSDCEASVVLSHKRYKKYGPVFEAHSSIQRFETDIPALWEHGDSEGDCSIPDIEPEDIAQIIYTSGTTGTPKGVMLSHRNLVANTVSNIDYLKLSEQDVIMAVLPFFYSYGNSVLLTHIAVAGTLVVNQSFLYPNVILDQMVEERVTGFSGVPSSFAILLNRSAVRDYSFPDLRYLTQAGAPMAPSLAGKLGEVFPDVEIFIMYGQTEAAPRLSYLEPGRIVDKAGSIGKAIPGVRLTVCRPDGSETGVDEVGEIVAEGENIMAGYWRQPEETAKVLRDGRLWTGDLAWRDSDGYLFIKGRKSALIKSGSHRIAPKEIEEVILDLKEIHEVAVVGHPDDILGERIVAFVVLKQSGAVDGKTVIRHCRKVLPAFKVPHEVRFPSQLPKSSTGKILTAELRDATSPDQS